MRCCRCRQHRAVCQYTSKQRDRKYKQGQVVTLKEDKPALQLAASCPFWTRSLCTLESPWNRRTFHQHASRPLHGTCVACSIYLCAFFLETHSTFFMFCNHITHQGYKKSRAVRYCEFWYRSQGQYCRYQY